MSHYHCRGRCLLVALCCAALLMLATNARSADVTVEVEGVTGTMRENVLQSLSIYQERQQENLGRGRIRRLHAQAPGEIRSALQPFGYYRPQIRTNLNEDNGRWTARYDIEVGDPVPIGTVDLRVTGEGHDDPEFRKLIEQFPLRPGEPLRHMVYEQAKSAFQRLATERGYFDQKLTRHEVIVDPDRYQADVFLHIDTGRRYRFGEVHIEQDLLDPALLARYVRVHEGEPYSASALLDLQTTLAGTEFFGNIEVAADPKEAQDFAIPVRVRLTRRPPNKYTFGLGYGTDSGVRGQLGWDRRYLNPEGHHISSELRASNIEHSFNAGYFIPIRNPRTDQLAFTTGYTESDINNTDSQLRHIGVSRTELRGRLQETLSLTLQNEKFAIGSQTGESELLIPGVTWSSYLGQDRVYTRQGARAILDLRAASQQIVSDTSLFQARLQTKGILPFFDFGRFIARADVGATHVDDFNRLPPSLRFYAGGDMSVRGYSYKSLGPLTSEGVVAGGKYLLVGSIEYEQHIVGNWGAAVFYDIGNALNDFNDPLARGAGIGLRWRSPVGQIRVDVASALSNPDHPLRVHIYFGPDL